MPPTNPSQELICGDDGHFSVTKDILTVHFVVSQLLLTRMSSDGVPVLQWITGCCSPSAGKNEYKGLSVLARKGERADVDGHAQDLPENADIAVVPRNYEDIKDENVQYFASSDASAGVGIIFQSTKPGYAPKICSTQNNFFSDEQHDIHRPLFFKHIMAVGPCTH